MAQMNFDLEDGRPPVRFSLSESDAERFGAFMDECQRIIESIPADDERLMRDAVEAIERHSPLCDGVQIHRDLIAALRSRLLPTGDAA